MLEKALLELLKNRRYSVADFEQHAIEIENQEYTVYIPTIKSPNLIGTVTQIDKKKLSEYSLLQNGCIVPTKLAERYNLAYSKPKLNEKISVNSGLPDFA